MSLEISHEINVASEKLKEAVERGDFAESSKDQLVVNLAHDLRTPLTSVLGYLDLILKDENLTKNKLNISPQLHIRNRKGSKV